MSLVRWGEVLGPVLGEVEEHFSGLGEEAAMPEAFSPGEIREYLDREFSFERAWGLEELVQEVGERYQEWTVHTPHPCHFGLYNPGVTAAGVAGDLLTAIYNPQLAAYSHAPFANEVERHVIRFFGRALGLDPVSGFFTSGGAEANNSAVMCAIAAAMPGAIARGLAAEGKRPTIYVSAEAHHSFGKAAKLCGLGVEGVRQIALMDDLTMNTLALEAQIEEDRAEGFAPILAVATAGTTSSGAIDPIGEIREVCDRQGMWMHTDAAWAGAVRLSPKWAHLLAGIEQSDSVTWDAHKWLQAPMGAGMFFTRRPEVSAAAFAIETGYMPPTQADALDPYSTTPQWSRRATGMKVFMDLAAVGREGMAARVDHMCAMGDLLKRRLAGQGWEMVTASPLPIACLTRDGLDLDEFLKRLYARRSTWMSATRLANGRRALRACITNHRTQPEHVEKLIGELNAAIPA